MDAPVYKKLSDIESRRENPLNTAFGQDAVSVAETFWGRTSREGKIKSTGALKYALPNTSAYSYYTFNATVDTMFYPKVVSISADVDAELIIQYNSNLPQVVSMYVFRGFVKAGTPVIITFDGDLYINPSATLNVGAINSGASAGNYYGSIYGIEVPYYA